jgi:starch synthase
MLHKEMQEEAVSEVEIPITYNELAKLAIRYSDGIIINGDNVSQELVDYAKSLGKPVLPKPAEEDYHNACNEFYDTVFG